MKSGFLLLLCLFLCQITSAGVLPEELIFKGRVATSLNKVTLHTDSTFTKPSNQFFPAGVLLEIIGETTLEHEDDAQNQKYKWFKVKSLDGKKGWIFGDGLAVIIPTNEIEKDLQAFHKKRMSFSNGFEDAIIWMAAMEGRDNFHKKDFLNPIYYEKYIVITNQRGRSVFIHSGGESTMGKVSAMALDFQDLTGDQSPEMILLRETQVYDKSEIQKDFELYSFQAGTMRKVFSERLNLPAEASKDHPCPFKYVDLDEGAVRIEYVDFKPCSEYGLALKTGLNGTSNKDQCMELVTYTYIWDARQKNYQIFYEESRSAPPVKVSRLGVFLQAAPTATAKRVRSIHPDESMEVVRQHVEWVTEKGKTYREPYFYVRISDGVYGYLPAKYVQFTQVAHAESIDRYYRNVQIKAPESIIYYGLRAVRRDSSAYNR